MDETKDQALEALQQVALEIAALQESHLSPRLQIATQLLASWSRYLDSLEDQAETGIRDALAIADKLLEADKES